MQRSGILFIISGASGSGKTTLCANLRKNPDFFYSVSCTTRAPRRGEVEGKDYFFVDHDVFRRQIKEGYFLEYAEVHGNYYGTPLQPVKDALVKGLDLLLDIDVQGAQQVRNNPDPQIQRALVEIFLTPPNLAELEKRLRRRATDDEATIQRRLAAARQEMSFWRNYDYVILSSTAEEDFQRFRSIMLAERFRTSRLQLDFE